MNFIYPAEELGLLWVGDRDWLGRSQDHHHFYGPIHGVRHRRSDSCLSTPMNILQLHSATLEYKVSITQSEAAKNIGADGGAEMRHDPRD
jgi:hypothetical protein